MDADVDDKSRLGKDQSPLTPSSVTPEGEKRSVTPARYGLGTLYVGFVVYVLFLAPGSLRDPGQIGMILAGKLGDVNDIFFALFNLLGAASVNLAALLNAGASRQKRLPVDLFSFAGLFLGFLAFGPYLIGRKFAPQIAAEEVRDRGLISRVLESKILAAGNVLYAMWAYAFAFGLFSPGTIEYHDIVLYASGVDLFRILSHDRGAFSSCLDFVILSTVIWGPLTEDMSRRGWFQKGKELESFFTALSFILVPVLGPSVYLVLRPPLPSRTPDQSP